VIQNVALVSEVDSVSPDWLTKVAAALQKQITRDFGPIWDVNATVSAIEKLEDVPLGYWSLIIVQDVQNAAGYHTDQNGQPYAPSSTAQAGQSPRAMSVWKCWPIPSVID
jgi:hypothetical protein